MRQEFEVPGRLDGLNEYTRANRANRYKGADMKRANQEKVNWCIKASGIEPFKSTVRISVTWIEPNMKRDPDNVRFGIKFILDALVEMGIIPDDTQKYVRGISDKFLVNRQDPRIIVEIEEV